MQDKIIIDVKNLVKSFPSGDARLVVLKGLDLHVKDGEFLAITGRSGSGKSTLLYQLGLLDEPDSGSILIDNINVLDLSQKEKTDFRLRELGYVFQDYALIPDLNALENVIVPFLMQGIRKKEAEKLGAIALEKVDLKDRLYNLPGKLSGGEQQRVSIARAIAHDPKILFADEPTANLDAETARTVLNTFLDLNKNGQTIVMVTHEPEYAALTNRIVNLAEGIIKI